MARNVIKRAFGTLKRRFSLMVASPKYSEEKQANPGFVCLAQLRLRL
jgi:hypothetical protein